MGPEGKKRRGFIICRFEGGKIAEEWEQMEELSMMQQMGVIPAEEKATA